ncbi:hypothetical protein Droror1_Dr00002950 [Drosera rotundifolia]
MIKMALNRHRFHPSYLLMIPVVVLLAFTYAQRPDSSIWPLPSPLWFKRARVVSHWSCSATAARRRYDSGPVKSYSRLQRAEAVLATARVAIKEAARSCSKRSVYPDPDYVPRGLIYRNPNAFHRSFLEMEKSFKIYVYQEGIPPLFHTGFLKTVYSTEGLFIHEMNKGQVFQTSDPDKAHVYFLPFSMALMVRYLYVPGARQIPEIGLVFADYINVISDRYPYWNQSHGADHLMLACHDWGPLASSYVPQLFNNSIRVLCNANTSEGFNPSKDATLPEINLKTGEFSGLIGGTLPPSKQTILAFFAGRLHGHVRHVLFDHWKEKDNEVVVYERLPNGTSYDSMLRRSKFCLCPSGYEVASPRIVEAIYAECVPVMISDKYVPPFSDVINWDLFSLKIKVRDIPNIKSILMGVSQERYTKMKRRVREVQRHFEVNVPPKRYDVFYMIVHSIWLRRLNMHIQDSRSTQDSTEE